MKSLVFTMLFVGFLSRATSKNLNVNLQPVRNKHPQTLKGGEVVQVHHCSLMGSTVKGFYFHVHEVSWVIVYCDLASDAVDNNIWQLMLRLP